MKVIDSLPGLPSGRVAIVRPNCCGKCKHSAAVSGQKELECREGPPTATAFMVQQHPNKPPGIVTHTGFPMVHNDGWCGRFAPRLEGMN